MTYFEQLQKVLEFFINNEWDVKHFDVSRGDEGEINVFGSCYTKEFTSSQDFFITVSEYGYVSMV